MNNIGEKCADENLWTSEINEQDNKESYIMWGFSVYGLEFKLLNVSIMLWKCYRTGLKMGVVRNWWALSI